MIEIYGLQGLEKTNFLVEGIDELVEVLRLCVDRVPRALGVVPLGVEVFDVHALLLNPGVVLEVVDSLALGVGQLQHAVGLEVQHVQVVVELCCLRGVGAVHFVQLFDTGLVHDSGVGQNGDDDVIFGQLIVLGKLDAAKNVRDAGNAHPGELFDLLVGKTEALEVLLTFLAVKQAQQALGVFVVNVDDHVGVLDIVDPGDVLVADAFDAVAAEAVIQNGRALERFADGELHAGITFFQKVACGHHAGGAGGEAGASESLAGLLGVFKEVRQRVTGDIVVPQGLPISANWLKIIMEGSCLSSQVLSKISLTLLSQPGVAMIWPAMVLSQSKRSLDISCGRMATESQARSLS